MHEGVATFEGLVSNAAVTYDGCMFDMFDMFDMAPNGFCLDIAP